MKQTEGQLTIFDIQNDGKPCRYSFKRYLGQKVRMMFGTYPGAVKVGTITGIDEYYSTVKIGGREYVGTPYNLSEVEDV